MFEMQGKHVQAELTLAEYEGLRRAAAAEGVSLKDAMREAVTEWTLMRGRREDPFFQIIGAGTAKPGRGSEDHDAIYEGS